MRKTIVMMAMAMTMAACSKVEDKPLVQYTPQQPAPAATAPQPVIVQNQQPQGGHDGTDMLMAGAVGYMLGSGGSSRAPTVAPATVVNKTVINKTYVQAAPAEKQTYSPPQTTRRTTSYSYRPSGRK